VDGEDYFAAVCNALRRAEHEILIAGWMLSPTIFLKRGPTATIADRFDQVLKAAADRGVLVYVLMWKETQWAVSLNSWNVKLVLEKLSPNICVLRHPPSVPLAWTHHQKSVVIDRHVAFVGGYDLAFGRWDSRSHCVTDENHLRMTWPGEDYYNPAVQTFFEVEKPSLDFFDRTVIPRMPWHDVGVKLTNGGARDVATNFVERWISHMAETGEGKPLRATLPPLRKTPKEGTCRVQVLRQIGVWSGGQQREKSIYNSYLEVIASSRHYLYFENQFFISNPHATNGIAAALYDRLVRAITHRELFRLIIVSPIHPEGSLEDAAVKYMLKFHYETLCRGDRSLLAKLAETFPGRNISQYVGLFSLRAHGRLLGKAVSQQVDCG
jgi:phospholipase D1/2